MAVAALLPACAADGGVERQVSAALEDPCGCFVDGAWLLDNALICVADALDPPHIYSSNATGEALCDVPSYTFPQPTPEMAWSAQRLRARCAGHYELCLSVHANGSGCELARQCFELEHIDPSQPTELPPVAGWAGQDGACSREYLSQGGYIAMRIASATLECAAGEGRLEVQDRLLNKLPIDPPRPDAGRGETYGNLPPTAQTDAGVRGAAP